MTVAVVAVTASIAQWLVQGLWKFFLPDEFKKVTEKLEDKFEQLKREMVDLQTHKGSEEGHKDRKV
jgi:hypothetical protein